MMGDEVVVLVVIQASTEVTAFPAAKRARTGTRDEIIGSLARNAVCHLESLES